MLQGDLAVLHQETLRWLRPGELAYFPPDSPFLRTGKTGSSALFIDIALFDTPHWQPLKAGGARIRRYESAEHLYHCLRQIVGAVWGGNADQVLLARTNARALLGLLRHEMVIAGKRASSHSGALDSLVQNIQNAPGAAWSVDGMAEQVFVSPRTLNKLFQSEYSISPMGYVIKQRIARGAEMLISGSKGVEEIAHALGYQSFQSFSNLFLKTTGLRPTAYRKKYLASLPVND